MSDIMYMRSEVGRMKKCISMVYTEKEMREAGTQNRNNMTHINTINTHVHVILQFG